MEAFLLHWGQIPLITKLTPCMTKPSGKVISGIGVSVKQNVR